MSAVRSTGSPPPTRYTSPLTAPPRPAAPTAVRCGSGTRRRALRARPLRRTTSGCWRGSRRRRAPLGQHVVAVGDPHARARPYSIEQLLRLPAPAPPRSRRSRPPARRAVAGDDATRTGRSPTRRSAVAVPRSWSWLCRRRHLGVGVLPGAGQDERRNGGDRGQHADRRTWRLPSTSSRSERGRARHRRIRRQGGYQRRPRPGGTRSGR